MSMGKKKQPSSAVHDNKTRSLHMGTAAAEFLPREASGHIIVVSIQHPSRPFVHKNVFPLHIHNLCTSCMRT